MATRWYADTSALVKLFAVELESAALRAVMPERTVATTELALIEVPRALARLNIAYAASMLAEIDIVSLSPDVIATASTLAPPQLRSLDAIHVATALHLGPDCDGIITYDRRMIEAARYHGLAVESPGRDP